MASHDGDIYVNDGESFADQGAYYPQIPTEQKEAELKEKAITAASYPVMADVAEWFKQAILDADDIHNIEITRLTQDGVTYSRVVSIEAQVLAFQLYKEKMQEKFDEFKQFTEDSAL